MTEAPVATLTVRLLLFGSYAESMGLDALDLALEVPATVRDALDRVRSLPGGDQLPARPLCALNLSQARLNDGLSAGDELAILPPLSGG